MGLLLAAMAYGAQVSNPDQNTPPAGTPDTLSPGLTVTSKAPDGEPPLPRLAPDRFTDCYDTHKTAGPDAIDYLAMALCEREVEQERRTVIEKCINRSGKNPPAVVIQACTELLDHKVFTGSDRFYVYANRAEALLSEGDRQHALEDYDAAVRLAPHNAKLYYNRAVFYLGQTDPDAALRDFDAALGIDPKLVPALLQRAKIRKSRDDLVGALADYSEVIRLTPKAAPVWSERGVVSLLQQDYASAIRDEAEAIRLDPKLARAYFLRGTAFQGVGDAASARADIKTALHLDPSLGRFVNNQEGKPLVTGPP